MIISRKKFNQELRKEYWRGFRFAMIKVHEDMRREMLNTLNSNSITFGDPTKDPGSLVEQMTREEINHFANEMRKVRVQSQALGWIPVSERLPKEGETVLVCYHSQGEVAQSVCEWFDMPNRGIVWSTLCGQKPIAWQPLPKPYKVESEGNE